MHLILRHQPCLPLLFPTTTTPIQLSALAVYIVCGLFSKSFVTNFVVVVVLLMADFWTVRRKKRRRGAD